MSGDLGEKGDGGEESREGLKGAAKTERFLLGIFLEK